MQWCVHWQHQREVRARLPASERTSLNRRQCSRTGGADSRPAGAGRRRPGPRYRELCSLVSNRAGGKAEVVVAAGVARLGAYCDEHLADRLVLHGTMRSPRVLEAKVVNGAVGKISGVLRGTVLYTRMLA